MFLFQTVPEPYCSSWALSYDGCKCMSSRFTMLSWFHCFNVELTMLLFVVLLIHSRPRFQGHNQALRKKERNRQRSREYQQQIAAAELLIEEAFAVAPVPPPQPMFSPASPSPSSTLPPPLPPPAHRAVRRLGLVDIAESSSAPNSEPNTSPCVDDSRPEQPLDVDALASPALASLAVPRTDQYISDSESDCISYFTSEGGRLYRSQPAKLFIDRKLYVHKDYAGRLPLCYYSTGRQGGSSHDLYECFDGRDIM
jgi:hypothetical protein